jgi:hypothetical protein
MGLFSPYSGRLDSYKLNPSLGAVAPTPTPQSGLFVYGVKPEANGQANKAIGQVHWHLPTSGTLSILPTKSMVTPSPCLFSSPLLSNQKREYYLHELLSCKNGENEN